MKEIKVKIPPTLRHESHVYEVVFDDTQEEKEFKGTYSERLHMIFLNPKTHPQQLRITYLHEILHLLFNSSNIDPTEQDVVRLAEGLGEVLFSNLGIDFDFSEVPVLERSSKK